MEMSDGDIHSEKRLEPEWSAFSENESSNLKKSEYDNPDKVQREEIRMIRSIRYHLCSVYKDIYRDWLMQCMFYNLIEKQL